MLTMANGNGQPNKLAVAAGFGIGLTWIAMALWCLIWSMRGYSDNRTDYGFIWAVVGVLLLGCGIAALFGTWWHQFALKRKLEH